MSDTLTQLIAKIQALLGDDGTIFTTATCTAAIRKALAQVNMIVPVQSAELISAVTDQYEYEITTYDSRALYITDILLQDDDQAEYDISLVYDDYMEDERLFFRLRQSQDTGDILIARFTIPHTVNGLDSATESTLPAWQDATLVTGASSEALKIRAYARVEKINLAKEVSQNYKELAHIYEVEFLQQLRQLSNRKRAPVGEPNEFAWNDKYHSWGQ